jgi:hypothetical protein
MARIDFHCLHVRFNPQTQFLQDASAHPRVPPRLAFLSEHRNSP